MYGKKVVNKENILALINSYDIFKKYIVGFVDVNKAFKSELRVDKSPTCVVFKGDYDILYKDYAVVGALDCFGYMMHKFNCTYYEALEMINLDFALGLSPQITNLNYAPTTSTIYKVDVSKIPTSPANIKVKVRKWNHFDKAFWNKQYQFTSKELDEGKVYPIDAFWINNMYFKADATAYGYFEGIKDGREIWKIYQPYSKNAKFFTNIGPEHYQGFLLLPETGDKLIITKSYKDVLVLRKLGIYAINPPSESSNIKLDFYNYLLTRFQEVVLLFDNDEPGIRAAIKLKELIEIKFFVLPQDTKDCADYVKKYDYFQLKNYIEQCLETIR